MPTDRDQARRFTSRLSAALLGLLMMPLAARLAADIVQPVSVQLKEQEPNVFLVQWQVPKVFPLQAMPQPVLPADCRAKGERVLQDQPGTWLNRQLYRCPDGVAGQRLGIRYPFVNAGQTTMLRVDFLSGEQRVGVLNPGEDEWQVPEIDAGLTVRLWSNVRRAVLDGARHFVVTWPHWVFWLVIGLAGGVRESLRLATSFTAAQLAAVVLSSGLGLTLPPMLAEAGVALATVLLAAQILRPTADRRQLVGLAAVGGVAHGLGLGSLLSTPVSFADLEWLYGGLGILGMDATLVVLALILAWLRRRSLDRPWEGVATRGLSYACGATAVAAMLALVLGNPPAEAGAAMDPSRLPVLAAGEQGTAMPGSRRVAPQGIQTALQSFLSVEAFEVRHQILVRLGDFADELGFDPVATVPVDRQAEVKSRLRDLLVPMTSVTIDESEARPIVDRIDFLTVGMTGVLPRSEPVPEPVGEAFVGLTVAYLTSQTPRTVELRWRSFPEPAPQIPATVSDPEFSQTTTLTAEASQLSWVNRLSEDPAPVVAAVAVEPETVAIPLLALPLFVVAAALGVAAIRGRRPAVAWALSRVTLALALVVAPFGEVALALPASFGSVPTSGQARRILAGVLPNVYRAFEFREESDAYDRLAVSVTGETLSEVYLEHRRALEMEERGGARARVETVEVPTVRTVAAAADGGFTTEAVWVVGGTVTHFGHRHFRQNRYDARVTLVPVEGVWKIRDIELFDEERIR